MSTTVALVLIAIAAFGVLFAFWPKFRQMIRITGGTAVDGMTTAIEKERLLYKDLAVKVAANRIKVTNITGDYRHQVNNLNKLQEAARKAQADYDLSVDAKMPENVQGEKFQDFQKAQAAVTAQRNVVSQFADAEKAAKKALEASIKALEKVAAQVQSDEAKAELKGVFESAAEAIEAANAVDGAFSELNEASNQVDRELERAKARLEGSQGNQADQEFEDLAEKERLRREREAYDKSRQSGQ